MGREAVSQHSLKHEKVPPTFENREFPCFFPPEVPKVGGDGSQIQGELLAQRSEVRGQRSGLEGRGMSCPWLGMMQFKAEVVANVRARSQGAWVWVARGFCLLLGGDWPPQQ